MPELPEVEVVRRGIENWVVGRTVESVRVLHDRTIRDHHAGAKDFARRIVGRTINQASRRGKYMWLVLDDDQALIIHLGMSGQVLVQPVDAEPEKHLRVRFTFTDGERAMHFVDQRTFGGMRLDELIKTTDGADFLPASVAHIARDLLDPSFDDAEVVKRVRGKDSEIKRVLLDQTVMSGIGNIYADESLWRAKVHWATPASALSPAKLRQLIQHAREVMTEALGQGGTSFDAMYVNVNGESGHFDVGLEAYGRENEPCSRCGRLIIREHFMNRSSFRCPKCQRR